jgi:serine/threonine protein kinase
MGYKKIRELGRGGFGRVFEVEDELRNRFALKQFEPNHEIQNLIDKGFVKLESLKGRFRREVKYQSQLTSANVVKIIHHDLDADTPWFVMELAEGTLQDDLTADRSLNGDPSKAIFDILAGLEEIHKRDIVHRDLKPVNVLKFRNADGTIRYAISDFGLISAVATESTTLTQTGHGGGTPRYAAPELISKFRHALPAADIYSVGAILHDIFDGGNRTPYLELSVSGPCREIVEKCTKTNPARRYPDVASLRADIYQALVGKTLVFSSNDEKEIVELLQRPDPPLSDSEWDRSYNFLDDSVDNKSARRNVFAVLTTAHIQLLAASSPELLNAVGIEFSEYVRNEGHDFDYCDVLSDKLEALFALGSVRLRAHTLLSLLVMGVNHNRWFVERKFVRLASPSLDPAVAERLGMDVQAEGVNFRHFIERMERSINVNRTVLHPFLIALGST